MCVGYSEYYLKQRHGGPLTKGFMDKVKYDLTSPTQIAALYISKCRIE